MIIQLYMQLRGEKDISKNNDNSIVVILNIDTGFMFNTSKDFENYVPDTPSLIKVKAKGKRSSKVFF